MKIVRTPNNIVLSLNIDTNNCYLRMMRVVHFTHVPTNTPPSHYSSSCIQLEQKNRSRRKNSMYNTTNHIINNNNNLPKLKKPKTPCTPLGMEANQWKQAKPIWTIKFQYVKNNQTKIITHHSYKNLNSKTPCPPLKKDINIKFTRIKKKHKENKLLTLKLEAFKKQRTLKVTLTKQPVQTDKQDKQNRTQIKPEAQTNNNYQNKKITFNRRTTHRHKQLGIIPYPTHETNLLGGGKNNKRKLLTDNQPITKKTKQTNSKTKHKFRKNNLKNLIKNIAGIYNPGTNICWLNSVLQFLKILIPKEWLFLHLDNEILQTICKLHSIPTRTLDSAPYIHLFTRFLNNYIVNEQHDASDVFFKIVPFINNLHSATAFSYYFANTETYKCTSCNTALTDTVAEFFCPIPPSVNIHSTQDILTNIEKYSNIWIPRPQQQCNNPSCNSSNIVVQNKYHHTDKKYMFIKLSNTHNLKINKNINFNNNTYHLKSYTQSPWGTCKHRSLDNHIMHE